MARMTFLQPDGIVPMMDAVSNGWRFRRRAKNLQFEKWEAKFKEPVEQLRLRYDIAGQSTPTARRAEALSYPVKEGGQVTLGLP